LQEVDTGLGGELGADPGHLEACAVIDGSVEVLLERLGTGVELQGREVLDVHLDPLAGDGHGVALGFLPRSRTPLLDQACPLQDAVDAKDTEVDTFLGQVVGQATGTVAGTAAQS
jgi:hypothetical protein